MTFLMISQSSSSSISRNGEPGPISQARITRGAEHLVGSMVPTDAPTHATHNGRQVKLNFDFRVKPPRSQRNLEGRAVKIAWCQENHAYLDADGFVKGLRPDLFTIGQKLAFTLMTKAQNDKAYNDVAPVPLTVSSEAEKVQWEASLNDTGPLRDPIKFAAHLAKQTIRTRERLQAEENWALKVKSKQDCREVRNVNRSKDSFSIEEGYPLSHDGVIPAIHSATEGRCLDALQVPKSLEASRGTKRKASSESEDRGTAQPSGKKLCTGSNSSSISTPQQIATPEAYSDASSLTECPSDVDIDPALVSGRTNGTQEVEALADHSKSRTRLRGKTEYLLPSDEALRRKIESEGWPSFSSSGPIGTGKAKPAWQIVGERPVFSRDGRFCMRGSGQFDQASQLALRFQHIERPECELIYRLAEPDWDNKEALLTWVKNVQQFLRRHIGPRKSSMPYADEEESWLIEYAHEVKVDWLAVTAGSKDAAALFEGFEEAFPQSAKRNKAGVLLKAKRLLGLM